MEPSTVVDGDRRAPAGRSARGRTFNGAVDGCRRRHGPVGAPPAAAAPSMEPSTVVDGGAATAGPAAPAAPAFNGAVDGCRRRRGPVRGLGDPHSPPSMEPSTVVDGDMK